MKQLINGKFSDDYMDYIIFKEDVRFLSQLQGVGAIGGFVFVSSFIIWFILKKTMGINSEEK